MPIESSSTPTGEHQTDEAPKSLSVEEAAEQHYKRITDARKKLSGGASEGEESTTEQDTTGDEGQGDERPANEVEGTENEDAESTKEGDSEEKAEAKYADDGYKVKVTIDGEEQEFSVKDLKRLAGQEQSLTRKSQEVSEAKKGYEAKLAAQNAKLQTLAQRAQKSWEQYKDIDWAQAAKRLNDDEYRALRQDAQDAFNNYEYVVKELDASMTETTEYTAAELKEAGAKCRKALEDETSVHHIKGFNKAVYDEIRAFAVDVGMNEQVVNTIVDPVAIKLIHDAMQWRKAQKAQPPKTKPKTPVTSKNPVKPQDGTTGGDGPGVAEKIAMAKFSKSGSVDDAAEAYALRLAARRRG